MSKQDGRIQDEPYPEDDPERGIFWGPPDRETGAPRRWSRPWYPWRDYKPPHYLEPRP